MKNRIILMIVVLAGVIIFLSTGHFTDEMDKPNTDGPMPPPRMTAIGPVGRDIVYTEMNGPYIYTMQTARQNFKRARVLGFESNLVKKMVVKDLVLTISKEDKTILAIKKDSAEFRPDMQVITINNPHITIPANLAQPDKIRIDKIQRIITFFYGNNRKVWKLK